MKKNGFTGLLMLFVIGVLFFSCERKNTDIDFTKKNWKVVSIKPEGEAKQNAEADYILDFKEDNSVSLNLDINACGGSYDIPNEGSITFTAFGCTEACCDSEFAEEMVIMFPDMTSYYVKGNELTLEGDGKIILEEY